VELIVNIKDLKRRVIYPKFNILKNPSESLIVAIALALVLAIGINASQETIRSGDECGCGNNICQDVENNTALPNEAGCEHFFICIDGHPIPNTCPQGQWFNPDISQCDNSTNPCTTFQCPEEGIHFFPHEEYCYKFIMCFAGYVPRF